MDAVQQPSKDTAQDSDSGNASDILNTLPARRLALVLLVLASVLIVPMTLSAPADEPTDFEWYNSTWRHRLGFNITAQVDHTETWPIERRINFTKLLRNESDQGSFDIDSIRVFEYDSQGNIKYPVRYQFVKGENYDRDTNAYGTLIFKLNGTMSAGESRQFFVYYDSLQHGPKPSVSYSTNLTTSTNGQKFTVNTTKLNYSIDTKRKNWTSGIYRVRDLTPLGSTRNRIYAPPGERSAEYVEYSNGTHRFTFNLSRNYTIHETGPLRLTVTQRGYPNYYNIENDPENLYLIKRYYFYNNAGPVGADELGYVRVQQTIINTGSQDINISSTFAGALAVDVKRTLQNPPDQSFENINDPVSWAYQRRSGQALAGIININESGPGFLAMNYHKGTGNRTGINLTKTELVPGEQISETALFAPGADQGSGFDRGSEMFEVQLVPMFNNPPSIDPFHTETYHATADADTNATIYNRNETVKVVANMTEHPYNITYFVNATLNWNTSEPAGKDTIRLDFNGSHVWKGTYKLQNDSVTGNWTVNVTAYTRDRIYLDHAYRYINVTDLYFTNVAFNNSITVESLPLWGNVTVQNARQDQFVTGANISCVYGDGIHVRPSNITAFNSARFPGVYSFNFTAPPADRYTLRCNATKAGNLGQNQADFTTEVAELVPNVTLQPPSVSLPNVTLLWGQNFTYTAEINNTKNGTAYSANISIDVPVGWTANRTFARCGGADLDLDPGETCSRVIEIHAPNATVPANYSVNTTVEWINPIGSYNNTTEQLRTDVEKNPLLRVNDTAVNGSVGGGQTVQVGDFLIESLGNFNLSSVNMTCPQGMACQDFTVTFDPANFSTLDEGSNQSINVSVFVPKGYQPGNYSGTINASAATTFDTLELNINVINTTQVETNVTDTQVVADTVTRQHGENITFRVNATNSGEAFAYGANISLELPRRWRSNDSTASLGEMDVGNFSVRRLWVTVPNSTVPNNYTINATTNWTNPDSTHDTSRDSITVWVQEHPVQNVTPRHINGTVPAGKNLTIGNLTVDSIGNFNITNVQYRCFPRSGTVCDNFTTTFDPASIPTLEDGENRSVDVNVSVPTGYQAGNYTGIVRVNSSGGAENLTLNVEVPPTRTWDLRLWDQGDKVNFCQQAAEQGSGLVCDNVTIVNTGNTFINFTAIPRSANNTTITQQNFSLSLGENQTFNVNYSFFSTPTQVYNATYNISTVEDSREPFKLLNVSLKPAVPPNISVDLQPAIADQNESITIVANVTSGTVFSIAAARANVTTPFNTSFEAAMNRTGTSGGGSLWEITFPAGFNNSLANTTIKGNYTVNITANDSIGNDDFNSSRFLVTANLVAHLRTLDQTYEPGQDVTLLYNLTNISGEGIGGAQVNYSVEPPQAPPLRESFITAPNGEPPSFLEFQSNADFEPGIYPISFNATWFDLDINFTEHERVSTSVAFTKAGQVQASWDTQDVLFPGVNYTAHIILTREGSFTSADQINLTVLTNGGQVFQEFEFDTENFTQTSPGIYHVTKEIPVDAPLGLYWSKLHVKQGNSETVEFQSFRLADEDVATGPFDIRLDLVQDKVRQGEDIGFNITMKNQGNESGDAKVTYWVEKNGTRYDYISETIFVPRNTTVIIPRNLHIYDDQPLGDYRVHAEVTPLFKSCNEADKCVAESSFRVIQQENQTQDQETRTRTIIENRTLPRPNETEEPFINISIIDAPSVINLVRGRTSFRSVTVANTGDRPLQNVSLVLVGVPPSWYHIRPSGNVDIRTDRKKTFSVRFNVPEGATIQTYNGTFLTTSTRDSVRSAVEVNIFASLKQKIQADIERLQQALQELKDQMEALQEQGADVSELQSLITQIELNLRNARKNLNQSQYQQALNQISNAESLISRSNNIISKIDTQQRQFERFFQYLPLVGIILGLVAAIIIGIYLLRVVRIQPLAPVRERFHDAMVRMKKHRKQKEEELRDEKRKTERLLELLEAQHKEGIMSDETYQDLKTSAEQKLDRINDKLRKQD